MNNAEIVKSLVAPATGFDSPYDAGFDCGKNGVTDINCNFKWFGSKESMLEWERGKRNGIGKGLSALQETVS